MGEYHIRVAARYLKRQFEKAVGRSILKVLTELVTNADDSYRRLKVALGSIAIDYDRRRRQLAVVDQAQGLTDTDMIEAFVTYGAESANRGSGVRTRSLFGKGLRDVLFTQQNGLVQSIKDGQAYVAKFRWRDSKGAEGPVVDIALGPPVTQQLRQAWGIPVNGTRVQFKLRDDVSVPQYEKLARDLANFYMLRRISQNADRRLVLRVHNRTGGWEENPIRYEHPALSASTELAAKNWDLEFEGTVIRVEGVLLAYESEMVQGEGSYEDREGGLLVVDEDDNVLDLSLFGFDDEPAASRLFGELKLVGAGSLIRERLNASQPEEILTETRDGLDRKHPFYKRLRTDVDAWLKPFVDTERQRLASKTSTLSDETKRRHQRAFDRLNRMYNQLLGESSGPGLGPQGPKPHTNQALEFRLPRVTLPIGERRVPQLLINTARVSPGTTIAIAPDDSTTVFTLDDFIETPEPDGDEPTVVVQVALEGLRQGESTVRASAGPAVAAIDCVVVEQELPDLSAGLAFIPDLMELRDGERSRLTLFADLSAVGRVDEVRVLSSNPRVEVFPEALKWEPITNFVVRARLPIIGRGKGEEAAVTATVGHAEAMAVVKVLSKKQQQDRRKGGMFKGVKFAAHERRVQAVLDLEGYVVVNLNDPTNQFHFGKDPVEAQKSIEDQASSQTLLAELVLGECLHRAVAEAYEKGKLRIRFAGDPTTDIRNYVAEKRFELGAEVHRLFSGTR